MARREILAALAATALSCSSTPPPAPPTIAIASAGPEITPILTPAPSTSPDAPPPRSSPAAIAWETDERAARERARKQGMPMIVWVRAAWAAAALTMERTTWSDPRVAVAAQRFVALKLDVTDAEGDAELYADRYGVEVLPATLIFDASGRKAATLNGTTDVEPLLEAMRRAGD